MHEMQAEQEQKNFERNVSHYIKVHRELHGTIWKWEDVARDLVGSFQYDGMACLDEIERQEKQGPVLDFGSNQEEHF